MDAKIIKWVWFDLDDTLHDFGAAAKKAIAEVLALLSSETGLSIETIQQNYRAALQKHNEIEFADGRTSRDYRSERFLSAIGHKSAQTETTEKLIEESLVTYERGFMDNLQLKPFARETLQELREKDMSLAILTDAPADAQDRVIKRLGIDKYFASIFTSGSMRVSKKNGLFTKALDRLNISSDQVVMVGNSPASDIAPALTVGIEAIWFNDIKAINDKSYREIQSLDALVSVIEHLARSRRSEDAN